MLGRRRSALFVRLRAVRLVLVAEGQGRERREEGLRQRERTSCMLSLPVATPPPVTAFGSNSLMDVCSKVCLAVVTKSLLFTPWRLPVGARGPGQIYHRSVCKVQHVHVY